MRTRMIGALALAACVAFTAHAQATSRGEPHKSSVIMSDQICAPDIGAMASTHLGVNQANARADKAMITMGKNSGVEHGHQLVTVQNKTGSTTGLDPTIASARSLGVNHMVNLMMATAMAKEGGGLRASYLATSKCENLQTADHLRWRSVLANQPYGRNIQLC